jgi:DNA polymerase-3 subunit delta
MSVVFDLSEAITNSDSRQALRIMEDLLTAGEAPVFLTSMLARQFHLLLAAKACADRGLSVAEASPYLDNLPPFVLQRLYQQQRRFTWEALSDKLLRVVNTDWRLKNGLAPVPSVEMTSLITGLLAKA